MDRKLRIAVAQTTVPTDPGDRVALRAAGEEIRGLMRQAAAGARLLQLPVDAVLLSLMADDAPRALLARAYAILHCYWVGYAIPAQYSATAPSGLVAPGGRWTARCPGDGRPALAVADIDPDSTDPDIDVAVRLARPWRRTARARLPADPAVLADPRSRTRTTF